MVYVYSSSLVSRLCCWCALIRNLVGELYLENTPTNRCGRSEKESFENLRAWLF